MALRKIAAHASPDGARVATVYRDAEWQEYRVTLDTNGKRNERATYHTSDRADALETARAMVNPAPGFSHTVCA